MGLGYVPQWGNNGVAASFNTKWHASHRNVEENSAAPMKQ